MRLEFKGTYLTHDKVTKVIYMILCTKCKRKYTRETDNLKERTYNSRSQSNSVIQKLVINYWWNETLLMLLKWYEVKTRGQKWTESVKLENWTTFCLFQVAAGIFLKTSTPDM